MTILALVPAMILWCTVVDSAAVLNCNAYGLKSLLAVYLEKAVYTGGKLQCLRLEIFAGSLLRKGSVHWRGDLVCKHME